MNLLSSAASLNLIVDCRCFHIEIFEVFFPKMLKLIFKPNVCRRFCTSRVWRKTETENKVTKPNETSAPPVQDDSRGVQLNFVPTEYEKTLLVLSGRFKSKKEIPPRISYETFENAKSRIRIRGGNILMLLTVVMCCYYIWVGKQKAKRGEIINRLPEGTRRMMDAQYSQEK